MYVPPSLATTGYTRRRALSSGRRERAAWRLFARLGARPYLLGPRLRRANLLKRVIESSLAPRVVYQGGDADRPVMLSPYARGPRATSQALGLLELEGPGSFTNGEARRASDSDVHPAPGHVGACSTSQGGPGWDLPGWKPRCPGVEFPDLGQLQHPRSMAYA